MLKSFLSFVCAAFASLALTNAAEAAQLLWAIGAPDGAYGEFAIAKDYKAYSARFPADVDFTIGQSEPKRDWPYVLPGPLDAWAGRKPHVFKINFRFDSAPPSYSRLTIDFVNTHPTRPPFIELDINGVKSEYQLPAGRGVESLTNPKQRSNYTLQQLIASELLHTGENTITLINASGSWALFDDVRLEGGVAGPDEPLAASATPLPFYKKTAGGLRRAINVSIENLAESDPNAELAWSGKTSTGSQKINVPFGRSETRVTVPDEPQVRLTLRTAHHKAVIPVILPPGRKWNVFIVPTVHTDIGYTDLQDRVRERHAENGLHVLEWLDQDPSFKWFSETWWQLNALLTLHPEKSDEVFKRLREKRWGLSGDFANMLTGLCSSEALDRLTADSRSLANRGGFDLNSVVLDDVPSAVGSVPMVLAHSGIKYFIEGCNRDRAPYSVSDLPMPFYWEGPDGSRVLAAIVRGYGQANRIVPNLKQAAQQLPVLLAQYETTNYPYDAVLINGAIGDNHTVEKGLLDTVQKWNAEWEYPKLIFALPEDFFGRIEKESSGNIPVIKADFGGWWEDGAGSSALETQLSRRAEERAVAAEMLHSLAGMISGTEYPKADFDDLWHNILLYNEHTWGASRSIREPDAAQTVKQWEVKSSFARQADAESGALLASGMNQLAAMIPHADTVVFNQLAWPRTAVATTPIPGAVEDVATHQTVPCQPLPEGGNCFVASDLPPIGYRSYRATVLSQTPADAVKFSGDEMENEFYRIRMNRKTGGIASIVDKQSGRELIDNDGEFDLGELIYVTGGEDTYAIRSDLTNLPPPKFDYQRQSGVGLHETNGPVFGEFASEAAAQDFPRITLHVRLYRGVKQLDLIFDLDKKEASNKEAVYLAFPFAVDPNAGGLWLEYPDEITEPIKDQHASACRDWYSVQRWLAISDGVDSVELSPLDTPLVTLGGMTASTWPRKISFQRGHIFAYVMNNYWHTNYKAKQGGHFVFRFSIHSEHGAFSKRDALVNGWNMYCPPPSTHGQNDGKPVFSAPARSLIGVKPVGLPLTTVKKAEDNNGFILRLCDFAGNGGTATLTLPAPARNVFECNLVETRERELQGNVQNIITPIKPFAPLTLKARFGQ